MPRPIAVLAAVLAAAAVSLSAVRPADAAPRERTVRVGDRTIAVFDHPGRGPAIVLMHGFPDDHRLYDRLVPELRGRRVVTFDFGGWGASSRPPGGRVTFADWQADLDAVVRGLALDRPVLVAHDASGPTAINWALEHPGRAGRLVLLNTFYARTPTLRAPEAIAVFSDPELAAFAGAIAADRATFSSLFRWQVGRFVSNARVRRPLVDGFLRQFTGPRSAIPSFRSLNRDLVPTVLANTARVPELRRLGVPTRIVFGERDVYLNPGVARDLQAQIPGSELFLLPARHYVQVDAPRRVARLVLADGAAGDR